MTFAHARSRHFVAPTESSGPDLRPCEIVQASSELIATADPFGDLIDANPAFRERFAVRSEGGLLVPQQSLFGLLTKAGRREFLREAVPALHRTGRWSGEVRAIDRNGAGVTLWQSAVAHTGEDGQPAYFSGIAHDVSAVKAVEAEVRSSEERFRALVAQGSDVILVVSAEGLVKYASPAIERVLGHRVDTLLGRPAFDLIHPDDLDALLQRFVSTISGDNDRSGSLCRARHTNGTWRWVELFASNHLYTRGIEGLIINGRDITARHDATEALRRASELLSSVMRAAASEAIIVTDRDANIVAFSRGAECLLGYTSDEVVGIIHPMAFHDADQVDALAAELGITALDLFVHEPPQGQSLVREWTFVRKDGSTFLGSLIVTGRYQHDGSLDGFLYLAADVTERRQRERLLTRAADHDPLTGLANRNSLQRALGLAVTNESWHSPGRVLLFLDLDRFKNVNDTLGHAAGDTVLIEVAQRLREAIRTEDLAVRVGGDEFVILLASTVTIDVGMRIAERIVAAIGQPFRIGDSTVSIGVSVGLTVSRAGQSAEQLLVAADGAAYQAKHAGRGRVATS